MSNKEDFSFSKLFTLENIIKHLFECDSEQLRKYYLSAKEFSYTNPKGYLDNYDAKDFVDNTCLFLSCVLNEKLDKEALKNSIEKHTANKIEEWGGPNYSEEL